MGAWNSAQFSLNCGWADGNNLFVDVCQNKRWSLGVWVLGSLLTLMPFSTICWRREMVKECMAAVLSGVTGENRRVERFVCYDNVI